MDMDFTNLVAEPLGSEPSDLEVVRDSFQSMVLKSARADAARELHRVRRDQEIDLDVKSIRMAEQIRKIMATLMAEANIKVESIAEDTPIQTRLPFEEQYDQASIAA